MSRTTTPGLTVLAHPDPGRIGDRAPLPLGAQGTKVAISRLEPRFLGVDEDGLAPLGDPHLSRGPVLEIERRRGLMLVPRGQRFTAFGQDVTEPLAVGEKALAEGVVLVLANRVALLLHEMEVPLPEPEPRSQMIGVSRFAVEMESETRRLADLDVPVLLLGETGTGKELVARALHDRGKRGRGPFVAVNMAALPPSVAAAELFGAVKGAFTGADRPRPGLVRDAAAGTLFLDEVGAMPSEVQALLLRFLEDRQVRSLGATRSEPIDVRVVAATDSDLESAVAAGRFSRPLLERFGGYEIRLSPLRQRRDDLGLLLYHFLGIELVALDHSHLLLDPGPGRLPWLPADLFAYLAAHPWPGNVRELRNVSRRIAIRFHDGTVDLEEIALFLASSGSADGVDEALVGQRRRAPNRTYREPGDVSDRELEGTMSECRWDMRQAAARLGVSRSSLYGLVERHPRLRKAADIAGDEIERVRDECGGDLEAMVDRLRVSRTALKVRMRTLGIGRV